MQTTRQQTSLLKAFDEFNQVALTLSNSYQQLHESVSNRLPQQNAADDVVSQHLRELVDAIPGAVIVLNARGEVVDVNASASDTLGRPLVGVMWRDIVSRVFLPELDQGELRTADGRQFSISTRPLGYQPGQILLLSDVTQTRQLQRAAQQNLHLMTMGKMMASLAHQIRTPLSSSMLYLSQVVDAELDADKTRNFSAKALARIKHIETMINDMLVFAHGGQFHMSDFSIGDLLSELQDQLQPQLKQRQATLQLDMPNMALMIKGNKDALLGAIANLCMNALDARESDLLLQINVSLSRRGDIEMIIRDNGCGMDDNTLKHLFDPFFTTKMDGTGLGLAVVKSVIESHQGQIAVQSEVDAGTIFEIHLPCQQASKTQVSQSKNEEAR